jgi:hypothetical protein
VAAVEAKQGCLSHGAVGGNGLAQSCAMRVGRKVEAKVVKQCGRKVDRLYQRAAAFALAGGTRVPDEERGACHLAVEGLHAFGPPIVFGEQETVIRVAMSMVSSQRPYWSIELSICPK